MRSEAPTPEPSTTTITPWLSVHHGRTAVDYYRAAFGADLVYSLEDDDAGIVVAQLAVAGAGFWIEEDRDAGPGSVGSASRMVLTVEDPDSLFDRAVAAGATEIAAVSVDHGWRTGRLADPFGHHWDIGKPVPSDPGATP
ncbi:VOC family protein [Actinopolymorpha pittospori]|uniref:PhnB protein n=1 Tax=Actinopolymorpha pittospori TaxID=648752 RepID=A0A927RAD2_9ACTN|nr:VOC family protein [Actinopolymorpha pittospori]MBE1607474.1 PhnB protein [Actinopolymorpha pittospori]